MKRNRTYLRSSAPSVGREDGLEVGHKKRSRPSSGTASVMNKKTTTKPEKYRKTGKDEEKKARKRRTKPTKKATKKKEKEDEVDGRPRRRIEEEEERLIFAAFRGRQGSEVEAEETRKVARHDGGMTKEGRRLLKQADRALRRRAGIHRLRLLSADKQLLHVLLLFS